MWRRPVGRFGWITWSAAASFGSLLWRFVAAVLQWTSVGWWRLWWTRDPLQSWLRFIGRCVIVVIRWRTDRRILLSGLLSLGLLFLFLRHCWSLCCSELGLVALLENTHTHTSSQRANRSSMHCLVHGARVLVPTAAAAPRSRYF